MNMDNALNGWKICNEIHPCAEGQHDTYSKLLSCSALMKTPNCNVFSGARLKRTPKPSALASRADPKQKGKSVYIKNSLPESPSNTDGKPFISELEASGNSIVCEEFLYWYQYIP